jgi:hypothetical protein
MATQKYALRENETPRLEISWEGLWNNTKICLDGQEIGRIANQKMLKQGQEYTLQNGSILKVQLTEHTVSNMFAGTELIILLNGKPLPNSSSDPKTKLTTTIGIVFFIAGLNIFVGLSAAIFNVQALGGSTGGIGLFVYGAIFLGLGFLIKNYSFFALIIAFILYSADSVFFLIQTLSQNSNFSGSSVFWILMRLYFLASLWNSFGAIRQLKRN